MIGAGDLDRRLVVQRFVEGEENNFGEGEKNWNNFHSTRAKRVDVRDSEKVAAGQVEGSIMTRFIIRSCIDARTITSKDRLSSDNRIWQILGVKEVSIERRHGYLELTATTAND